MLHRDPPVQTSVAGVSPANAGDKGEAGTEAEGRHCRGSLRAQAASKWLLTPELTSLSCHNHLPQHGYYSMCMPASTQASLAS